MFSSAAEKSKTFFKLAPNQSYAYANATAHFNGEKYPFDDVEPNFESTQKANM